MGRTTAPPIGLGCSHTCLGVRGEVCIVEPWFTPEVWENGRLTADLVDQPSLKIARVLVSGREQSVATLAIHYLVAQPEGVETFAEKHRLGLFTHEEYLAAFRAAKLAVTYDPVGLLGRELYIGVRPLAPDNNRGR